MGDITPRNASNRSITLISAQTAGATSEVFTVPDGKGYSFFCDALGSGETVAVEALKPDGTWTEIKSDLLNSTAFEGAVYSKGIYRLVKSATSSAVGVYAFSKSFTQSGRK